MHTIADKKLLMLRPDDIIPSAEQPRLSFDEYELACLAESIAANGIIQPLTVRRGDGGKYILIAGERRLRAAKIASLRRVPCVIHKTDDVTASLYSITENIHRADLNFFEEAAAIKRLSDNFGLSQSEIAVRLGMAGSTVCNKLRLLKLDAHLRKKIISSNLSERHARALLRLPAELREDALNKIIADGLTLAQTEMLINEILNPSETREESMPPEKAAPIRKAAIGDIKLFANSLAKLLNTMQNAGIEAHSRKYETEKYIEYKVRIQKNDNAPKYTQLKIC